MKELLLKFFLLLPSWLIGLYFKREKHKCIMPVPCLLSKSMKEKLRMHKEKMEESDSDDDFYSNRDINSNHFEYLEGYESFETDYSEEEFNTFQSFSSSNDSLINEDIVENEVNAEIHSEPLAPSDNVTFNCGHLHKDVSIQKDKWALADLSNEVMDEENMYSTCFPLKRDDCTEDVVWLNSEIMETTDLPNSISSIQVEKGDSLNRSSSKLYSLGQVVISAKDKSDAFNSSMCKLHSYNGDTIKTNYHMSCQMIEHRSDRDENSTHLHNSSSMWLDGPFKQRTYAKLPSNVVNFAANCCSEVIPHTHSNYTPKLNAEYRCCCMRRGISYKQRETACRSNEERQKESTENFLAKKRFEELSFKRISKRGNNLLPRKETSNINHLQWINLTEVIQKKDTELADDFQEAC